MHAPHRGLPLLSHKPPAMALSAPILDSPSAITASESLKHHGERRCGSSNLTAHHAEGSNALACAGMAGAPLPHAAHSLGPPSLPCACQEVRIHALHIRSALEQIHKPLADSPALWKLRPGCRKGRVLLHRAALIEVSPAHSPMPELQGVDAGTRSPRPATPPSLPPHTPHHHTPRTMENTRYTRLTT